MIEEEARKNQPDKCSRKAFKRRQHKDEVPVSGMGISQQHQPPMN